MKAQALVQASMAESIERRADAAFSIKRTEPEYTLRFGESFESVMLLENRQDYGQEIAGVMTCTCQMRLTEQKCDRSYSYASLLNLFILSSK